MQKEQTKENIFLTGICGIAMFVTVMSRMNINIISKSMTVVLYVLWALILLITFTYTKRIKITSFGYFYLIMTALFVLYFFWSKAFIVDRMTPGMMKPFVFSFFIYQMGTMLGISDIPLSKIKYFMIMFCLATFILAVSVRIFEFSNIAAWMNLNEYVYADKNYTGQLLGVSIIFLLFYLSGKTWKVNLLRFSAIAFLAFVSMIIQCRSAMIAVVCVCSFYLFSKKDHKLQYIGLVITILCFLIFATDFDAFIRKSFFIDKYQGMDLNTFTSGRFSWYSTAIDKWKRNIFFGIGSFYVDDLYINVLTECGIVGFFIVIPVCLVRFGKNLLMNTYENKNNEKDYYKLKRIIRLLTVFYIVESIAEGYPPFGPGVASFWYWFLAGYADSKFE